MQGNVSAGKVAALLVIITLALIVRGLTANFVRLSEFCVHKHTLRNRTRGRIWSIEADRRTRAAKFDWASLLSIRPAEVYGANSNEGIDRMLTVAQQWRIIPALFGNSNLLFAPLHVDDFGRLAADLILQHREGVSIEHLCGPEDLSGIVLARRISRHCERFRYLFGGPW